LFIAFYVKKTKFMPRNIQLIFNKSEITAGTRGASLGPEAIVTAARKKENDFFGRFPITHINDQNFLLDQTTEHQFAKRIDGLVSIYQELNQTISKTLQENKFPFVIASDHGSAGGTIAGIKSAFPSKRLGVVWIDAHGDLHSPYTTPSGNIHGMPLSTALNEDNLPSKSNEVPEKTSALWNELKNIGGITPKIFPQDLIFIAVRDTEQQEDNLIKRFGIKNYTVDEVNEQGEDKIVNSILNQLSTCDMIYISFDVDSMDPKLTSHGTGTPVDNGLSPNQAINIMNQLIQSKKVVCVEVVEVNPCLDEKTNKMAETAFEIIENIVITIENN
jgi:arginase